MALSLKDINRPGLVLVVVSNIVVYYLILTSTLNFDSFRNLVSGYESYIPGALIALVVGVLNSQLNHSVKARLVFWRWKHPLPGSHAFTKIMLTDSRIDPDTLLTFSNPLPTGPDEQNRLWFKWYREFKEEAGIKQAHREYLFTRDWTGLAFLFLVFMMPLALWQTDQTQIGILAGVLLLQYFAVRQSAINHGERFVASVLAYKSAT
jgi:hypothetical protein